MTYRTLCALLVLTCASFAFGHSELNGGDLSIVSSGTLGSPVDFGDAGPRAPGDPIAYSNITTFLGSITAQAPSANEAGNQITRLAADDITPVLGAGLLVSDFTFSVVNANTVPVSFRPRVRLYSDVAGAPGPAFSGASFNPITVPANTIILLNTGNAIPLGIVMPSSMFWAGVTFDNNIGATGATAAQMDNIGQGFFNPPAVGSSADVFFVSTAAGSHFPAAPAGATGDGGPNLVANLGWQFRVIPEPGSISLLGLLGLLALKRRR